MANSRVFELHTINNGILVTNVNLYPTTEATLSGINLSRQLLQYSPDTYITSGNERG